MLSAKKKDRPLMDHCRTPSRIYLLLMQLRDGVLQWSILPHNFWRVIHYSWSLNILNNDINGDLRSCKNTVNDV